MGIKDKKYQILSIIGTLLLLISTLSKGFIPYELRITLLGFSVGWMGAVYLLKHLIWKEEARDAKLRSDKALEELNSMLPKTNS